MTRAANTQARCASRRQLPTQRALHHHLIVSTALVGALATATPALAQVLPGAGSVAGQFISGEAGAKIAGVGNPVPTALQVDLKANATIINWNGFNVPVLNTATFSDTRAAGATGAITVLNRDIGSATLPAVLSQSVINGAISSDPNVSVFLINRAGVLFGSTAVVKVGGLVASAVDITNGNFLLPAPGYVFAGSSGGKVVVTPGATLTANSAVAPGSVLLIGEEINTGGALSASGDIGIVLAAAATITLAPGSPLSIALDSGTSLTGLRLVAAGSIAGRNVVFAAASQAAVNNVLLDIEAVVTATTAVATDRGIVLVAGPNSETDPLATIGGEGAAVGLTLGGALTATGAGGGVTLLTSSGIAAPTGPGPLPAVLTATRGVRVHAATGDIVLGSIDGGTGTASILADDGGITLDSATGNGIAIGASNLAAAAAGRTTLISAGDIGLTLSGSALLGAVITGGTATVQAASVDATSLSGATALSATGGALMIGSAASANGSVKLVTTDGSLAVGSIVATTAITVQASGAAQVGSASGSDITLTATDLAGTAGGRASFAATGGLDITVANAASLGSVTAAGHATIGAGAVDATSIAVSGGPLTATATGGDLLIGSGSGGTGVILKASGGFGGGTVTSPGTIKLTAGGALTAIRLAGDAGLTVKGSTVDIGSIGSISALADVSTSAGLLTIGGGSVQAGSLVSAGDLGITGTLSGTGPMLLSAQGKFSGGTIASTGSTLQVNATGAVSADSLVGATGLTISGTTLALDNGGTTSGDALLTSTTGGVTLGSAATGANLTINAATIAAVTGAVITGNDYRIAASAVTLGGGAAVLQSAGGVVDITAGTGAITGLGLVTLRSDSGGAGGHLLALDAATGINFAVDSLLQGGPAQQSGVGVRVGSAGPPLVLGGVGALRLGTIDAEHTTIGTLSYTGAITLGGAVSVTQSLNVSSTTGTVSTAVVTVTGTGETLSLNSGIAADVISSGTLSASGGVALAADRNIAVADVLSSGGPGGSGGVTATALGNLTAGTIITASAIAAMAGGGAAIADLVSGTSAAATDRSATVTAASVDVGTVTIGSDLRLKSTAGPLTLSSGSAGNSATLTTLAAGGVLMLTGSLDVGTAAGSIGTTLLTSAANARVFSLRSLTGDVTVAAAGAATVSGAVDAHGDYAVTGTAVTLGSGIAVDQHAGGSVTIKSTAGDITGAGQLMLTSDNGGLGGRDLTLRSAGSIAFGETALSGGPARSSTVRLGAASGAAITLGQIDALRLVSYNAALTATALDSSGTISADRITVGGDLSIGSTVYGRPVSVTLNAATSLTGAITLQVIGAISGPLNGETPFASPADLTAATAVTTRSSSAQFGFVTAGSAVDLETSSNLDVAASSAGTTTTLTAGGDIRLASASGTGGIAVVTGGDVTGFATAPQTFDRAVLTSKGGGVTVTANGPSAATGLVLLGGVNAATGVTVTARQIDIASAAVSAGNMLLTARELLPANLVSLTLGTATASGDIVLASAAGTGALAQSGNGGVTFSVLNSTGANASLNAAGAATGTSLTAAQAITLTAASAQLGRVISDGALNATTTADLIAASVNAGTTATLTAAGDGAGTGIASTGTGVTITAGGAVTGTTLSAAQAIAVTGQSLDIASATADTTLTTTTTGRSHFGGGGANGAILVTAGSLDFGGLTSAGGDVTLAVAGGAVTGTTLSAGKRLTITAASLNLNTATAGTTLISGTTAATSITTAVAGGDIALTAGTTLDFGTVTSTGGSVALAATGAAVGTSIKAAANVTIAAAAVAVGDSSSAGDTTANVGGGITATSLAAGRNLLVTASSLNAGSANAGGILTAATTGLTHFGSGSATGDVVITAGALDFGSLASGAGDATLAVGGALTGTMLSAAQAIAATAASVQLGTATAGTALGVRTAADLGLAAGTAATTVDLTAGRSLRLGSASGGGMVTLAAGGDITGLAGDAGFGRVALTSAAASVSVDATGVPATTGLVTLGAVQAATGATITGRQLDVTSAVVTAGGITMHARELSPASLVSLTLGTASAGGDIVLATTAGSAAMALAGNGTIGIGSATSSGGKLDVSAPGSISAGALAAATSLRGTAASLALTTLQAGTTIGLTSSTGGITLTGAATASDITLTSAAAIRLTSATSRFGNFAATAAGGFSAATLSVGKALSVGAADIGVDSGTAGGTLVLTARAGNARLGPATSGGDATVIANGSAALTGGVTAGGDLTVTASAIDLAAGGPAVQAARGAVTITATSGGITGGSGLMLVSGSGKAVSLRALGTGGAVSFAADSAIAGGAATAGADVDIAATNAVQLGKVDAAGHTVSISGSDATLAGTISAAQIALTDSGGGPLRLGNAPAANTSEFVAVAAGRFDLSSAEVARLSTPVLVVDARLQNVVIGDLPVAAGTGASSFAVRTLGRLDILGRITATGSAAGRSLTFGGDGSATGLASVIRIATTLAAGGRLGTDARLVLAGDRVGAGYDANLLVPLALTPGAATALTAADVAARYISQPNSALYVATTAGQPPYSDPVIVSAAMLVINYGRYAVFQNTGQPGPSAGAVLGTAGAATPALQLGARDAAVPNAFAVFGTVNGIGGVATALLGSTGIGVGGAVSRADTRANGCVIGAASGGCLASSLAQPGLQLFTSRSEILRSSDTLTLPFDPLVGTSNEALFSDIAGVDLGADISGVTPAEAPIGAASASVACAPSQRPCKDQRNATGAPK